MEPKFQPNQKVKVIPNPRVINPGELTPGTILIIKRNPFHPQRIFYTRRKISFYSQEGEFLKEGFKNIYFVRQEDSNTYTWIPEDEIEEVK